MTEAQVRSIRQLLKEGATPKELGEIHQLSVETIRRIGRRESWAWVADHIPAPTLATLDQPAQALSPSEQVEADEILQRLLKQQGIK